MTHLLMIRAVPRSLPTPCFCFDLHPSIMSFAQHHLWDHYMTFPSSVFLAFHIPSLIRPGRVWGVWAQGCSYVARDSLWSLDGLRYVDWSIAWWDCHLFRSWLVMGSRAWWDHRLLCFEMIIFEIIMEHLEYSWCIILEGWHGYITWTSILSIDHLRAWEHDVWDRGRSMGGLHFG